MTKKETLGDQKSKIRGEVSHGMICAEDELGLGESHEGIMVLDEHLATGTPCSEIFEIEKDHTIEIGLTPNRCDAMSHMGVARDLKAGVPNTKSNSNGTIPIPIRLKLTTPPSLSMWLLKSLILLQDIRELRYRE